MSPDGGACATRGHVIVLHSAFCLSSPERGSNLHFRLLYVPGQLVLIRRIDQPTLAPGLGDVSGLGDVQLSLYMPPVAPFRGLIWGLGPSFSFATASDRSLGAGKDSAGLSTAVLTIHGPWLVGVLITDVASIGGQDDRKSVHQFLMQPFVDYNFSHGWYLASAPPSEG
jgi:hypothetical protein